MSEAEVSDYIRTNKGNIYKVEDIDEIFIYVDREVKYIEETNTSVNYVHKDNITKHSKNIIDLIEVGDYVNGYKVDEVRVSCFNSIIFCNIYKLELVESDIKTIVTKEQFESVSYKV